MCFYVAIVRQSQQRFLIIFTYDNLERLYLVADRWSDKHLDDYLGGDLKVCTYLSGKLPCSLTAAHHIVPC